MWSRDCCDLEVRNQVCICLESRAGQEIHPWCPISGRRPQPSLFKMPVHPLFCQARDTPISAIYGGHPPNDEAHNIVCFKRAMCFLIGLSRGKVDAGEFLIALASVQRRNERRVVAIQCTLKSETDFFLRQDNFLSNETSKMRKKKGRVCFFTLILTRYTQ